MDTTIRKIEEILSKIKEYVDNDGSKESEAWYKDVKLKASDFRTDQEKLEYLEGILDKLEKNDGEGDRIEATKSNTWPAIALGVALFILVVGGAALYFLFLAPKSANATNGSTATVSSTISKSVDLPKEKEDFQVIDYKVDGDAIVYNRAIANTQHKVFANGSEKNSISSNSKDAVDEMIQYMSHNATALKEKAMAFGIVDTKTDVKDWLVKGKDGKVRYNDKGKDVFYQTKAFITRSQLSSKKMANGSSYYTTGVNDKGDVVISRSIQDLSGQEYVEVASPKGSTEKYRYCVLVYCGNTVMKKGDIPGIPTENIEIPKPNKPGKPSEPGENKDSVKDPSKDPYNHGKAPIGGGENDGSANGAETTQAKLPESYSAPTAPSSQNSSSSSATTPAQDARISEPSQWSGAGMVTDSNGTTKVTDNGAVTTPDGRHYDDLVGKSAPAVEAGTNGVTTPSSSANFTGSSMSQPGIDD